MSSDIKSINDILEEGFKFQELEERVKNNAQLMNSPFETNERKIEWLEEAARYEEEKKKIPVFKAIRRKQARIQKLRDEMNRLRREYEQEKRELKEIGRTGALPEGGRDFIEEFLSSDTAKMVFIVSLPTFFLFSWLCSPLPTNFLGHFVTALLGVYCVNFIFCKWIRPSYKN